MSINTINVIVRATGSFDILSPSEINKLQDKSEKGLYPILRQCSLGVLNSGAETDDINELMSLYADFDMTISQKHDGLSLILENAPSNAFVDGKIIKSIKKLLFSVLRDLIYTVHQYESMNGHIEKGQATTDLIFHILKNAHVLRPGVEPDMVVVWGGHSVTKEEYEYTKEIGYQLGLRKLSVTNGSGPGVMSSISAGAKKGHIKQGLTDSLVCGISEPQILAAEVPNEYLDALVIMPDIEKRLEAFIRFSSVTIVCCGGAGTMEEIFSLVLTKLAPANKNITLPLIFTAPTHLKSYFEAIDDFIGLTLGKEAQDTYDIIIGDAVKVAELTQQRISEVYENRLMNNTAFYFNWAMEYPEALQDVFDPSHANMSALRITPDMSVFERAVNLRSLMSGIVAGNVKQPWVGIIEDKGPYEIHVDALYVKAVDHMLKSFVQAGRMKITGEYKPCYTIR